MFHQTELYKMLVFIEYFAVKCFRKFQGASRMDETTNEFKERGREGGREGGREAIYEATSSNT